MCDCVNAMVAQADELDRLRSALEAEEKENAALRLLLEGKDELLASYRTGRNPRESTWTKIESANKALGRDA